MPYAKYHKKEKIAQLDKKRRPKRRNYFKEYYYKKIKENEKEYEKMKIRALTRHRYGKAKECIICGSKKNVQHHHYTEPYEVDKFFDLCEEHHMMLDYLERYKKGEII